ncbi:MAG: mobile mystery protein B [Rhodospirillaceae bacterium]|nr:mobile mystery protein B [Rhodospirillaceae bacterium]
MSELFHEPDGATLLTPDEQLGLRPSYITTRGELNHAEQENILSAEQWAFARRRDVLTEPGLKTLHKRMFGSVWRWAGTFRTTPRNIGVEAYRIAPDLRCLLDDVRFWREHETYQPDELAVRFHHRLVAIHPFPNGNGRCGRLAADMLILQLQHPRFTWGGATLTDPSDMRRQYIAALRAADGYDLGPLIAFARS